MIKRAERYAAVLIAAAIALAALAIGGLPMATAHADPIVCQPGYHPTASGCEHWDQPTAFKTDDPMCAPKEFIASAQAPVTASTLNSS